MKAKNCKSSAPADFLWKSLWHNQSWSSAWNLDHKSRLREVLQKARQRSVVHLLLDQSALALTIGMGGAIVLLLAGTQLLDWYWVALLTTASLGVGVYRLRQTIPSVYKLAQRIDRRLCLADALSTATYFESDPTRGHEAIRERQRAEAESIARSVDLKTALPFVRPRYVYPALALTAVALGLFALRYAVTGTLSLQPSLVKMAFDTFFPPKAEMAKLDKKRDSIKSPIDPSDPDSPTVQNNEDNPDQVLDSNEAPDMSNPQAGDNSKEAAQKGRQDEQQADVQGDNSEKGDKQSNSNDSSEDNAKQNSKDGKQQSSKEGKQGSENQNSSLMDKLKDAMANMMNKMKSSSKDGQQSQQQNAQNSQQGQKDKSNQQGKQGQQQQQAQSDAQSDQQQSDAGDKKQTADAKGSEKSSDKNASQDSKSGIGSADGDKAAKEAEQLKAMGKISEILGKRAQNVTGEVMVEVGSSKQQLKTPWAQKQAAHAEAGSEIHRDEVPLMYQQFVQQYFEEIRKAPAAPKPAKSAPKSQNPGN